MHQFACAVVIWEVWENCFIPNDPTKKIGSILVGDDPRKLEGEAFRRMGELRDNFDRTNQAPNGKLTLTMEMVWGDVILVSDKKP